MKLYNVSNQYISELRNTDSKVLFNKVRRPYLGIVLQINTFNYFVPLSSAKDTKNTNNQLSMKINEYDPKGKLIETLAYIQFLNMIPVKKEHLEEIDIEQYFKSDMEENNDYYNFVIKELAFIRKNKEKIEVKAKKVYQNTVDKKIEFFVANCCKYKSLEEVCG
uniref:type III toxin-antitoxin system ToxN/AbiQ family toxin n=1 Tax=Carnobacterium sp. TaxID=48221 RepID=UPI00159910D5|nr:type III toxin-antitoxin system ToxN/AbiQ family toxin [Carnobacterium sp.]QJS06069.1 toxin ToxN, type III toxin-antitoxin system [Carnobacterium sp.]